MNTAVLLNHLRTQAVKRGIPLDHLYMDTLRRTFCQRVNLNAEAYQAWRNQILKGVRITDAGPWGGEPDEGEPLDIPKLLALGDACARDQETTGSFYTPQSIARFMSGNALRQTLHSRFPECAALVDRYFDGRVLLQVEALELQGRMRSLRILDLACGNGVFLGACLDWYVGLGHCSGFDTAGCGFVSESLCGTDIRADALESWAIYLGCKAPEFLEGFSGLKVACVSSVEGDAVLEMPWMQEVLEAGGFDLVIGNPPYLGEKGNRQLFEKLRESSFGQKYYQGRMDLFYYFLHRGIDFLKNGGILAQITTSYYATADFASKLRGHLQSAGGITGLVSFNDQRVFNGAKGHHLILFYQKGELHGPAKCITYLRARRLTVYDFEDLNLQGESTHYKHHMIEDRCALFDERGHIVLDPGRWESDLLDRLNRECPEKLKDLVRINQGIVSGADRLDSGGIFVLEPEEVFPEAQPWLVPWYKNGDIRRYKAASETDKRLIYIGNEDERHLGPQLLAHFSAHREKLSRRRECLSGARPWYGLQWPRERRIFEGPKLVAPQRSSENRFAYTEGPWFASADVYFLTRPVDAVSLWSLLAYLNSDLMGHWFHHCGKRKGKQLELYATPLGNVPVNREWFRPGGELEDLGKALYESSPDDEMQVSELRRQVEAWLAIKLG